MKGKADAARGHRTMWVLCAAGAHHCNNVQPPPALCRASSRGLEERSIVMIDGLSTASEGSKIELPGPATPPSASLAALARCGSAGGSSESSGLGEIPKAG